MDSITFTKKYADFVSEYKKAQDNLISARVTAKQIVETAETLRDKTVDGIEKFLRKNFKGAVQDFLGDARGVIIRTPVDPNADMLEDIKESGFSVYQAKLAENDPYAFAVNGNFASVKLADKKALIVIPGMLPFIGNGEHAHITNSFCDLSRNDAGYQKDTPVDEFETIRKYLDSVRASYLAKIESDVERFKACNPKPGKMDLTYRKESDKVILFSEPTCGIVAGPTHELTFNLATGAVYHQVLDDQHWLGFTLLLIDEEKMHNIISDCIAKLTAKYDEFYAEAEKWFNSLKGN